MNKFIISMLITSLLITPKYDFTEQDVLILGDMAWLENGHTGKTKEENLQCIIATMAVGVNRMISTETWLHKKGTTGMYSVVYAPGQYAIKTRNNIGKTDTPQWVYDLAREVLIYGTNVPEYVIYQGQNKNLGTLWCPPIDGEYFATEKGHYMEGKGVTITTNKEKCVQKAYKKFLKRIQKMCKKCKKFIRRLNSCIVRNAELR